MTRTGKSGKTSQWAVRQARDPFVRAARRAGFRARAVFKLEQVDRKHNLIKPASVVVDLGAAPGSWSQYAAGRVGAGGRVIAVDLLPMKAVEGAHCIRGDFTDDAVVEQVLTALGGRPPDLVLSDMAPNLSGIASTDQARMETLQQAVLRFCRRALKPGGTLLTKLFAGECESAIRRQIGACFARMQTVKPEASRAQSREIYLLAGGYKDAGATRKRASDGLYWRCGAT